MAYKFILDIPPKPRLGTASVSAQINSLRQPDGRRWLPAVVFDWLIIIGAMAAAHEINQAWAYVCAILIIGPAQQALAILGHDGAHRLACRHRQLNDALSNMLVFWPLGMSMSGYRRLHFMHHKYTNTALDPELVHKKSSAPQWDLPLQPIRLVRFLISDLLGLGIPEMIKVIKLTRPVTIKAALGPAITLITASCLLVWSGNWWVLGLWFGALYTSFWAVFRTRLWFEHVGAMDTHRFDMPFWLRIVAPHNTWYHWEHHKYSSVPFWNLPTLRELDLSEPVIDFPAIMTLLKKYRFTPSGAPLRTPG